MSKSILRTGIKKSRRGLVEFPVGRVGRGPRPEDIEYLVELYIHRRDNNILDHDGMTPISNHNVFKLLKMADSPIQKIDSRINNEQTSRRIQKMLNGAQRDWRFTVEPYKRGPDIGVITRYKVQDVGILNVPHQDSEPDDTSKDEFDMGDLLDI